MTWCHQTIRHHLSQCWPRSMSTYGITRPHWFNLSANRLSNKCVFSIHVPCFCKPLPEPMLTPHQQILWHSSERNFIGIIISAPDNNLKNEFENQTFKITLTSPRSQWVNSLRPRNVYMHQWTGSALDQIMACSAPSHYMNQCWFIVDWNLWKNYSEILIKIRIFSFKKMNLKMSSAKWWPCCLGCNVLIMATSLYCSWRHQESDLLQSYPTSEYS